MSRQSHRPGKALPVLQGNEGAPTVRWRDRSAAPLAVVLVVMVLMGTSACSTTSSTGGSKGNDTDKIVARVRSVFAHWNAADVNGLLSDLPPSVRATCGPAQRAQLQQEALLVKRIGVQLKDVRVDSIMGERASVTVTNATTRAGQTSAVTNTVYYIKVGSDWYVDPDGKSCTQLFSAPTPAPSSGQRRSPLAPAERQDSGPVG